MWSTAAYCQQLSQTAQKMQSLGWQNIETEIPNMPIDLKYTTADNFVGTVLYGDLKEAFLHPDAMRCLKKAQILLKAERPEYSLIVYDAGITNEQALVKRGKISKKELQNRLLLRNVMKKAGFRPLPSEWWHFNFCSRNHAKQHYKVMP